MLIHQFEDKFLSHFSYAILEDEKMVLIDPARNPQPYYNFATKHHATIIAVIETHLHADFVSSHVEIANAKGALIYMHPAAQPEFSFQPFEEQSDPITLGKFSLHAIHTPGHSPDSICILLKDEYHQVINAFTGDTLFIGFVGRPDLRKTTFTKDATRESLARQMFHSIHEKILKLPDEVMFYPAHGSGSLCGKNLSSHTSSTIGAERFSNIALQPMSEHEFVDLLLEDQPMAPKYFPHSVAANRKKDLPTFKQAMDSVSNSVDQATDPSIFRIDTASSEVFKRSHLKNSINIPGDGKFETWLGALVSPEELFLLLGENGPTLNNLAERIINIGYEKNFRGFASPPGEKQLPSHPIDIPAFSKNPNRYTILDVRNASERKTQPIFENSIHIPLHQLRERIAEIPRDKPVVTHCGGGNRGAIAASILETTHFLVFDLGVNTKYFIPTDPTAFHSTQQTKSTGSFSNEATPVENY